MAKITTKIVIPIILAGIFAMAVFIAVDYERLKPSFYILVLLIIIYVFLFGVATGQRITSPIKKILEKAEELSRGNLSSRVYLETKDELSELGKAFNLLAEKLEASQANEANTEKSLGVKVKARTEELEEVINALEQKVRNRTIEMQRLTEELNKLQEAVKNKT